MCFQADKVLQGREGGSEALGIDPDGRGREEADNQKGLLWRTHKSSRMGRKVWGGAFQAEGTAGAKSLRRVSAEGLLVGAQWAGERGRGQSSPTSEVALGLWIVVEK